MIGVVFVSYLKVPEQRLQDHFRWNGAIYESYSDCLRVFVVTDTGHDLPPYALSVIYPMSRLPLIDGRRRFSLTATKNAGIDRALGFGCDSIVVTDVDIAFNEFSFSYCATDDQKSAAIPVYRMAESFEERDGGHLDRGCTGTVGMTATNWRKIRFDERCVGYGGDDGLLLRDIRDSGLEIRRDAIVSHIAHCLGDGFRRPGHGADTCYGRDDGFNFDNFRKNRLLHRDRPC